MNSLHIFYYKLIDFLPQYERYNLSVLSNSIYTLAKENGFYEKLNFNPLVKNMEKFKNKYYKHRNTINRLDIYYHFNQKYWMASDYSKNCLENISKNLNMFNLSRIKHISITNDVDLKKYTTLFDLPCLESFIVNGNIDNCKFSSTNLKYIVGDVDRKGIYTKSNKIKLFMNGKGSYLHNFEYNENILTKLFKWSQITRCRVNIYAMYSAYSEFRWQKIHYDIFQNWRLNNMFYWDWCNQNINFKKIGNNKFLYLLEHRFTIDKKGEYNYYNFEYN